MNAESLSDKYQLLLQENLLLKKQILFLEDVLKHAGVTLLEDISADNIVPSPVNIPSPTQSMTFPTIPEQPPTPNLNKYSLPAEKIRLYMSLFKGREDVYAHKYFNKKEGKMVYGPVKRRSWERKPGMESMRLLMSGLSIIICVGLME